MPALAGFRLLYETPSTNVGNLVGEFQFKLFGVLPGANVLVRHARPRATIWAVMPIQTNQGRTFRWIAFTQADGSGSASLAIPYATGLNGQVRAFACNISDGGRERQVALLEKQVVEGETVVVDFLATGNLSSSAPTSGNRG